MGESGHQFLTEADIGGVADQLTVHGGGQRVAPLKLAIDVIGGEQSPPRMHPFLFATHLPERQWAEACGMDRQARLVGAQTFGGQARHGPGAVSQSFVVDAQLRACGTGQATPGLGVADRGVGHEGGDTSAQMSGGLGDVIDPPLPDHRDQLMAALGRGDAGSVGHQIRHRFITGVPNAGPHGFG